MKLFWGSGVSKESGIGNAFGYYIHNTMLRAAVEKVIPMTDKIEDTTDVLYILSPEFFKGKVPGVRTWLFTMFEGNTIPEIYKEKINEADYLLTPSTFVKELFDKYFDPNKIFVVPHGVDKKFSYRQRQFPNNKPFRFLWVGAPNPRKGYEEVLVVWKEGGWIKNNKVELYLKTTRLDKIFKKKGIAGKIKVGNIIADGRRINDKELIKMYHNSHCFLFPTRGEGFGLTLAEAMRTGLPCISPYYSGVTDFFDSSVGYVISHKEHQGKVTFIGDNREEETGIILPDPNELFSRMVEIYRGYKSALKTGQKASQRIYRQFTWNKSAQILKSVIESVS